MGLQWLGDSITAMFNSSNPWLTAFGMIVVLLIVLIICGKDVIISYIENMPKTVEEEKKDNKKNR